MLIPRHLSLLQSDLAAKSLSVSAKGQQPIERFRRSKSEK